MAPQVQALNVLRSVFQRCLPESKLAGVSTYHKGCLFRESKLMRSYSSSSIADHYDVAIIGAGPSGLTLSMLLSQYGVKNVVLERDAAPSEHPRAHFINHRTMEVFRTIAGLASKVQAASPPLDEWRRFIYCESLTGNVLGTVDHFPGAKRPLNPLLSPEPVTHLPQNQLVPLMLQHCKEHSPHSSVLLGHNVLRYEEAPDGCLSVTSCSNGNSEQTITCRYLVASDGANSTIRHQLPEIKMEGKSAMQNLISVHFLSSQLAQLLKPNPAMLYFVFNTDVVGVIIAHNLTSGEFVAQFPYSPPLESISDFPPEACARLVNHAVGVEVADVSIKTVKPWIMSALVASKYQKGRVFLVGDAAHRMPPSGGFGMNTAIQDSHNLAWKLAAVINGTAPEQLLGSYEMERRPVAEANTKLSVTNWHDAVQVPRALGLDPDNISLLTSVVDALPLPATKKKTLYQSTVAFGRQLGGLKGPFQSMRQTLVRRVFNEGDTLRLQFPKQDLGFSYTEGALYPFEADSNPRPARFRVQTSTTGPSQQTQKSSDPKPSNGPSTSSEDVATPKTSEVADAAGGRLMDPVPSHKGAHPSSFFTPLSSAGYRLPHCPLLLYSQQPPAQVSTLDLLSSTAPVPTLMLGWRQGQNAQCWMEAARQLVQKGCALHVVCIVSHIREAKEALTCLQKIALRKGNAENSDRGNSPKASLKYMHKQQGLQEKSVRHAGVEGGVRFFSSTGQLSEGCHSPSAGSEGASSDSDLYSSAYAWEGDWVQSNAGDMQNAPQQAQQHMKHPPDPQRPAESMQCAREEAEESTCHTSSRPAGSGKGAFTRSHAMLSYTVDHIEHPTIDRLQGTVASAGSRAALDCAEDAVTSSSLTMRPWCSGPGTQARCHSHSENLLGQSGRWRSTLAVEKEQSSTGSKDVVVAVDIEGRWEQLVGSYDEAVVLTRPDGHVGWKRRTAVASQDLALAELWQAWDHCMGRHLHVV